jgi:hypothetical protein
MLVLRPPGRGNWHPLVVAIEGRRLAPLLVRVGQRMTIGDQVYRIAKVVP